MCTKLCTPAVLKYLMANGLIDGSCMTVTGKTLAENLQACPDLKEGQDDRWINRLRRLDIYKRCTETSPRMVGWQKSPARKVCT